MTKIQSNIDHSATRQIEIKSLDRSPLNVRKTDSKTALQELKASIQAHGLMQNLIVIPGKKGKYHVIAGGRRLAALRELLDEGKLPADHAVPCQIAEQEQAEEMSLAENVVRQAMNPADEFEAFATLIEQGKTAAEIAARFGTTERHVLQRMKLGRVAPELLAAYRAEEMTLDALIAFAITDDHKKQIAVWKSLEGWQENNVRQIRSKLSDQMIDADDDMVKFVGLDAYKAAGGTVRADLFSEEVYLEDAGLLNRLAMDKLEAEADKIRSEGWGWVEIESDETIPAYRCRRIEAKPVDAPAELEVEKERLIRESQELEAAMDAIEDEDELDALYDRNRENEQSQEKLDEKLAAYAAFDMDEMQTAGCIVSIGNDGELEIERGLVKPEQRQVQTGEGDDMLPSTPANKEKPEFSQSLVADMKAYRCQAAQVEIASHPEIAFDLLVFHAACDALSLGGYLRDGLDVHFRKTFPKPSIEAKNTATEKLESTKQSLPLAWLEEEGEAERFQAFRQLADADKHRILAYCVALTLKPDLAWTGEPSAYEVALSLTGGNVAVYWRPTKDNYLSRINREQLVAVSDDIYPSALRWNSEARNAKKSVMAEKLHAAFARSTNPDTWETIRNWLPKGMAFRPVEQEAEPEKKPASKSRKSKAA